MLYSGRKEGHGMKDKLCVFERRTKMLIYITTVKYATRLELAEEFNVSLATINRDVVFLSTPICGFGILKKLLRLRMP